MTRESSMAAHPAGKRLLTPAAYRDWARTMEDQGHSYEVQADATSGLAEHHRAVVALRDHYNREALHLRRLGDLCNETARELADLAGDVESQPLRLVDGGAVTAETAVVSLLLAASCLLPALAVWVTT